MPNCNRTAIFRRCWPICEIDSANRPATILTMAQNELDAKAPAPEIFRAPNGLEIFHHSASETAYLYQEIFEDRVYFRHGIDLKAGESVFDIGANIGMFTLFVKENFQGINVHAFEPSPVIHPILKANVAKYGASVTAHEIGVSNKPGEAKFTFYPNYSIMSGLHAGGAEDRETLRAGIRVKVDQKKGVSAEARERSLDFLVDAALEERREYVCRLRTVSEIIDESDVRALGLLKIDAEGSELDILAGIRGDHWGRIRQIVMEIHDPKGTARQEAANLLQGHGYKCVFEEEKRLAGSGIVNCYARRA